MFGCSHTAHERLIIGILVTLIYRNYPFPSHPTKSFISATHYPLVWYQITRKTKRSCSRSAVATLRVMRAARSWDRDGRFAWSVIKVGRTARTVCLALVSTILSLSQRVIIGSRGASELDPTARRSL